MIVRPDASQEEIDGVLALVPEPDRHKWFRSMNSSQALAQSVFGNLAMYGHLHCLSELEDDEGEPLLGGAQVSSDNFEMEFKVNHDSIFEKRSTAEVEINGVGYRVRYIGMDTPETGAPFYREATEANRRLVAGQSVILVKDVSETDRYGRLLRYVYLADGTFVNAELVRQGYAQVATFPPDVKHQELFLALQAEARAAGLGLWGQTVAQVAPSSTVQPQPTAPPTAAPTQPPLPTNSPVPEPTSPPPAPTDPPPAPTEPPAAPGNVQITTIFFDGEVAQVESDEYAVISNQGGAAVNLAGWRLNAGDPGQDFVFPAWELQPGQSCRVYTNESHPDTCGFSFGRGQAIWNNGGDCGYLFDGSGNQVSQYCY